MNTSFTAFISLEQIRDKAGCKGRKKSNPNDAVFPTPSRPRQLCGAINLLKRTSCVIKELLTRVCESDTARMARKQRNTETIFQTPNTSTYGRLLNLKRHGGATKTTLLGRGDNISQVPHLNTSCSALQT